MKTESFHFRGDRAAYTGETRIEAGLLWYVGILTEGHEQGRSVGTYTPPGGTCPLQARNSQTRALQAAEFATLHKPSF